MTGTILATFDLQVTPILPINFQVKWLFRSGISAQEMKCKIDFQDVGQGGHLGYPIRTILAIFFYLKFTLKLPNEFQVNWHLCPREVQYRFLRWWLWQPSLISDKNDLDDFDLQIAPILPTKFQVNWPFCSWEEVQNRFSRCILDYQLEWF